MRQRYLSSFIDEEAVEPLVHRFRPERSGGAGDELNNPLNR
jgi:hypothetical protein